MSKIGVILVAAGRSSRFGDVHYKKPFAPLAGRPVWLHAAEKFCDRDDVGQLVVVIAPEDRETFLDKFGANLALLGIDLAEGGDQRAASVRNGLAKLAADIDLVAIHDAARPCLAPRWIDDVFAAARQTGAAILGTPVTATLKRCDESRTVTATIDRSGLWEAQTPQVFSRHVLTEAFAADPSSTATDEAHLVQTAGHPVTVVPCSPLNLKITTRDDLRLAEQVLKVLPKPSLGGPTHPFADDDRWR